MIVKKSIIPPISLAEVVGAVDVTPKSEFMNALNQLNEWDILL